MMERRVIAAVGVAVVGIVLAEGIVAVVGVRVWAPWVALGVIAAVGVAAVTGVGISRLAARLPEGVDGAWRTRRGRAVAWGVLGVVCVVQTARLGSFMSDPSLTWASAFPPVPESARHICAAAYVRAGELHAQGEKVYGPEPYRAGGITTVEGLGDYLQDAFEYPPPFLLLPRAALAATNDFLRMRTVWYALRALAVAAALIGLAVWIGGREGWRAALLAPLVWIAMPTMIDFQFGQVHLLAIVLSVAGMMAFARGWRIAGGALLGWAVVTKIFPGVLIIYLLARRRWRDAVATGAAMAVIVAVAWGALGPAPFKEFASVHLPRMASGEAFAFFERSPETIADNLSLYGVVFKLRTLGVPGMTRELAAIVSWLYTLMVVGAAILAARRARDAMATRSGEAVRWLALLGLAALRSPFAPATYVSAATLWLLTLVPARSRKAAVAWGFAWLLLQGVLPLPSAVAVVLLSLPVHALTLGLLGWGSLRGPVSETGEGIG